MREIVCKYTFQSNKKQCLPGNAAANAKVGIEFVIFTCFFVVMLIVIYKNSLTLEVALPILHLLILGY